jgi:hypothetical protein
MIQRASDSYLLRLTTRVEEGGHWYLHHQGVDPPTLREQASLSFSANLVLTPRVDHGRWIVECPHCHGAQLASPDWHRFLCNDCANVAFGGRWLAVEWPSEDLAAAGEALLGARPDVATRNWDPTKETIGALKAENVIFGALFDPQTGAVTGDLGVPEDALRIQSGTLPELGRGE